MNAAIRKILGQFLRPYQHRFLSDPSRFIIVLKSRQIGLSECIVLLAILTARDTAHHDVYLCSTSLDNAKELIRRAKRWIAVLRRAGLHIPLERELVASIEFTNGSRIIAKAAKSVRSRSGTIILDEFAVYQHDRDVWRAVSPAAESNPNLRVLLVSTPFGASGVFWEIWSNQEGIYDAWSRHKIDIYQAAKEGFPVDPAEMQRRYAADVWRQEFCCEFLSDINQYFSYDLIRRSQYSPGEVPDDGALFGGIDLASKNDGSVLSAVRDNESLQWVDFYETIKPVGESMEYREQLKVAKKHLSDAPFGRVGVDAVGEGTDFAQRLQRVYGRKLIRAIDSGAWKEIHATIPSLKHAMETGKFKIPNDPRMRSSFAKIQKTTTSNRNARYTATSDADGHADEFFASLLAWSMAEQARHDNRRREPPAKVGSLPTRSSSMGEW